MAQEWFVMNQHKPHWKLSYIKSDYVVNLVRQQKCCVFWDASKEPDDQFNRCLLWRADRTRTSIQGKMIRIGKLQRYCAPPQWNKASCIFENKKFLEFGWKVMLHPQQNPDLTSSVYHLFRSLKNSLHGKTFTNNNDLKSYLIQFSVEKENEQWWKKIIGQNEKKNIIIMYCCQYKRIFFRGVLGNPAAIAELGIFFF